MGAKIYVGGLPYSATESQLQTLFSPHGTVESVRIITDKFTGQSRGFGLVARPDERLTERVARARHVGVVGILREYPSEQRHGPGRIPGDFNLDGTAVTLTLVGLFILTHEPSAVYAGPRRASGSSERDATRPSAASCSASRASPASMPRSSSRTASFSCVTKIVTTARS